MEDRTEDIIPVEAAGTLAGLFQERVRRSPGRPAYRWFDKAEGAWREIDWQDMGARVARWRAALAAEGLKPGERVAIQLRNGPDWICFDQAAQGLGLVVPCRTSPTWPRPKRRARTDPKGDWKNGEHSRQAS